MPKVIHCPCGYIIRAASDRELVTLARRHAKETHDLELSDEQALAMARPE